MPLVVDIQLLIAGGFPDDIVPRHVTCRNLPHFLDIVPTVVEAVLVFFGGPDLAHVPRRPDAGIDSGAGY